MLKRVLLVIVALAVIIPLHGYLYTTQQIRVCLVRYGAHSTPEAAMLALVSQIYTGIRKVNVKLIGPDIRHGSNPAVQYVVAEVWAESRADGSPAILPGMDHDVAGTFFAHIPRGWIYIPEDFFVSRGYFGFWLRVFRLQAEEMPT